MLENIFPLGFENTLYVFAMSFFFLVSFFVLIKGLRKNKGERLGLIVISVPPLLIFSFLVYGIIDVGVITNPVQRMWLITTFAYSAIIWSIAAAIAFFLYKSMLRILGRIRTWRNRRKTVRAQLPQESLWKRWRNVLKNISRFPWSLIAQWWSKKNIKTPDSSHELSSVLMRHIKRMLLVTTAIIMVLVFVATRSLVITALSSLDWIILILYISLGFFSRWYLHIPEKPYMYALLVLGEYYRDGSSYWSDYIYPKIFRKQPIYASADRKILLYPGGNTLFLGYPFLEKPVLFDTSDKNFKQEVDIRTQTDRVASKLEYEITWYIDPKNCEKFIETAGRINDETTEAHFKKVQEILHGMISDAIRELASSDGKPGKWEEAQEAKSDFVKAVLEKVIKADSAKDSDIEEARNGGAKFPILRLGIIVKRFNVPKVDPINKRIAEAKEEATIEDLEQSSQGIERDFSILSVNKIHQETGLSVEASADFHQSNTKKAVRIIHTVDNRDGGKTPLIIIPGLSETLTEKGGK